MSETGFDLRLTDKRRTLWIVLWLNAAIAVGFFASAYFGDSSALLANGLDNASDAAVYALSLLALTRSGQWKRAAARLSGIMLLLFAVGVVVDAIRRFIDGSQPSGALMMVMAAVAAGVNILSLALLKRLEDKDVNLRAATTFSFNDFVSNGGIVLAGIVVTLTGSNWPDLAVGIAVASIAAYGGIGIIRDAHLDALEEQRIAHRKNSGLGR